MKNADKPMYPQTIQVCMGGEYLPEVKGGSTKREYFAAMAMQGLVSATEPDGTWSHTADIVASTAVEYADALLKALEK